MKHLSPAEIETIRVPEPKHDPFTLESLVAWLEKMPAEKTYNFVDCKGACLLDQYGDAMRLPRSENRYPRLNRAFDGPPGFFIACKRPYTFGAALTRARAALASQKGNANG